MRECIGIYRFLLGKPERKRPFGRYRRRWEENIKVYLLVVESESMDVIDVDQDGDRCRALVNAVMNLRVP
jgi:hypothetical protein